MLGYKRGRGKGRRIKCYINLFQKNAPVLDKKEGEREDEREGRRCVWGGECCSFDLAPV